MEDITQFLAFEIKKELADRYFGFRKRIEEDTTAYTAAVELCSMELENKVGPALIRCYILLRRQELIFRFIDLLNLPRDFFYDAYTITSPTIIRRSLAGRKAHGLGWKHRYFNLFYDSYNELAAQIASYCKEVDDLIEEHETISEEIRLFYRKNDIDSIIDFLHRLDNPDGSTSNLMQTGKVVGSRQSLESKLRLRPPPPASELLTVIPEIPDLKSIRPALKKLLQSALAEAETLHLRELTKTAG